VDGLALKLVLTPTLIGAVSMAGRRWGPGVSGWLVGFPLTSGPVTFFLALDQGVSFAAGAAVGSMTGAAAQAVFCVLYGRWARGRHWAPALLAGSLGFAAATVAPVPGEHSRRPLALVRGAGAIAEEAPPALPPRCRYCRPEAQPTTRSRSAARSVQLRSAARPSRGSRPSPRALRVSSARRDRGSRTP